MCLKLNKIEHYWTVLVDGELKTKSTRAIRYHAKNQRPFKASVGFGRVMRLESDNINIPIWEKAMLAQIVIYDFTFPPFYAMIKFEFCDSFIKKSTRLRML